MKRFTIETMFEILNWLTERTQRLEAGEVVEFEVLDPDRARSCYAGEVVTVDTSAYLYRGYKAWSDLAELLFCRLLTPQPASAGCVRLRFEKLDVSDSFHRGSVEDPREKYGVDSRFFSINKNEEPAFLHAYLRALESVGIGQRERILNLGINTGDEFETIRRLVGEEAFESKRLVGVDHSATAIGFARGRFGDNVELHVHDINDLASLEAGRFDLLISIGTLQSPGINFKTLFMSLVQNHLQEEGALILGFPNCRWMGGEMIYGAKAPNYPYPEMSLLYKDVYFCKKYLQQHRFRVTLTGKEYLFLTATPIRR